MLISITVPCYNEEKNIPAFYNVITEVAAGFEEGVDFEFIFVNDGSKDETYRVMKEYSEKDSRVKYVSFSRNFGKEAAMLAGLEAASGDYVVVIDADLQDPPELIKDMYQLMKSGEYERIATRRVDRKGEPVIRSFFAKTFYKLINKISNVKIVDGARDYSMMSRRMVDSVLSLKEKSRFTKGLFEWPGYKTKWLEFNNVARNEGGSKWSFFKLFSYSIEGIVAFSHFPLVLSSIMGVLLFFISLLFIVIIIVRKLVFGDEVTGWASTACIILMVAGLQQFSLGIIGSYLARVFVEVKDRPMYVVLDTNIDKTLPKKD
ncbi:MAG: glycosyltransferase family 2 protein [Ruminococcus sp.]|nr:glycosyltransferase family 2 protein [Ruminococcus sp.]